MLTYRVSVTRVNADEDAVDVHYYVILDAEGEDDAKERAMHKAQSDYPGFVFKLDSCKAVAPGRKAVEPAL